MALRSELTANDPNFIWWIGDGGKSELMRGIFSITDGGSAYFSGALRSGIISSAVQSPVYGQNVSVVTDSMPTYGRPKKVVASLEYLNIGNGSLSSALATTIILERSLNNGTTWTICTQKPITGEATTAGNDVRIAISGSVTFTDNVAGANRIYRVRLANSSGQWPLQLNTGWGFQRLSVVATEE